MPSKLLKRFMLPLTLALAEPSPRRALEAFKMVGMRTTRSVWKKTKNGVDRILGRPRKSSREAFERNSLVPTKCDKIRPFQEAFPTAAIEQDTTTDLTQDHEEGGQADDEPSRRMFKRRRTEPETPKNLANATNALPEAFELMSNEECEENMAAINDDTEMLDVGSEDTSEDAEMTDVERLLFLVSDEDEDAPGLVYDGDESESPLHTTFISHQVAGHKRAHSETEMSNSPTTEEPIAKRGKKETLPARKQGVRSSVVRSPGDSALATAVNTIIGAGATEALSPLLALPTKDSPLSVTNDDLPREHIFVAPMPVALAQNRLPLLAPAVVASAPRAIVTRDIQSSTPMIAPISISNFRVLGSPIGYGSFGEVLRAWNQRGGSNCAIKCITKAAMVQNHGIAQNLLEEQTILKRLNTGTNPFVLKMHASFTDAEKAYLVMDHCPDGDLTKIVGSSLTLDQIRFYAAQLVEGLTQLNDVGIAHLDIKAENTLRDQKGNIKLIDFGGSRNFRNRDEMVRRRMFRRGGTPGYMAPEVYRVVKDKGYSWRADWWSVGVIIYRMLYGGAFPFDEDEDKAADGEYTFAVDRKPEFDVIHDLLDGLFELDPDHRLCGLDVKKHAFFETTDWAQVAGLVYPPPKPAEIALPKPEPYGDPLPPTPTPAQIAELDQYLNGFFFDGVTASL